MDFTFSEDQLLFQESVRDFLVNEVTTERIRSSWEGESCLLYHLQAADRLSS